MTDEHSTLHRRMDDMAADHNAFVIRVTNDLKKYSSLVDVLFGPERDPLEGGGRKLDEGIVARFAHLEATVDQLAETTADTNRRIAIVETQPSGLTTTERWAIIGVLLTNLSVVVAALVG